MQCPRCNGKAKTGIFLVHTTNGCDTTTNSPIPCHVCDGTGIISQGIAERIRIAALMVQERNLRDLSTREDARRMSCGLVEFSRMERGHAPTTANGKRVYIARLAELIGQNLISVAEMTAAIGEIQ